MIELIDTHCHLEMTQFSTDRTEAIKRAQEAGVRVMVTIGSDVASNPLAIELAEAHAHIYCTVGIHPHDAKDFNPNVLGNLKAWAAHPKVVGIGETGLDYHYDNSPRELQREVFKTHLELARELNLPAVIHSREADEDTIHILKGSGISKGILHCFSGSLPLMQTALELGLHISIAGPVTFKKATELQEAVRLIPDERLLIETDSPYLAPVPKRGKRNEPAYIIHTARAIAELRGVTLQDIARITTHNARTIFNIQKNSDESEITYRIRESLYLNITPACTNACTFCTRFVSDYVKGHNLKLNREPSFDEFTLAIGNPQNYKEIVFCGLGEPTLRLDLIKRLASYVKERGGQVRLNTNGHGNLINKRDILPELKGLIDSVSISLNAQDSETYDRICKPLAPYTNSFNDLLRFIEDAREYIPSVQATVVETEGVDTDACRAITDKLGIPLRVRALNNVG